MRDVMKLASASKVREKKHELITLKLSINTKIDKLAPTRSDI